MLPRRRIPVSWLLVVALVAALGVSVAAPAVSGSKALTLTQAKKLFVKKSKAKRSYVTKKAAAATYLRRTGETRVSVPLTSWKLADNTSDAAPTVRETDVVLQKNNTAAQDVDYFAQVPVPTVIGGQTFKVVGIEICYDITDSGLTEPIVDRIALQRAARATGVTAPVALTTVAADETGRVDDACTTVRFAPVALLPNDIIGVGLRIDYADANTQLRLGAGSLLLTS